ncbi:hypothetical protein FFR93_23865 [Rhizobium sp. MHM7A]|nr:hypothetical protein FFR93_23865 [Rhizobium sp. MHM7A]
MLEKIVDRAPAESEASFRKATRLRGSADLEAGCNGLAGESQSRRCWSMSRKSVQRFCDDGMRKIKGLKRGERI